MAASGDTDKLEAKGHKLYPAVAMYGPTNVRDLKKGDIKYWCACGLSKKQPWCDGSHKDTGFKPVKWIVPNDQSINDICLCKHTKSPPFCDATHTNLPSDVEKRIRECQKVAAHTSDCKLCTQCGWFPDF